MFFGPFWFRIGGSLGDAVSRPQKEIAPVISGPTDQTRPLPPPDTTPQLSNAEEEAEAVFSAFGAKIGLGLEIPLIKKSYVGIEVAYLYTDLHEFENNDLSNIEIPKLSRSPNRSIFNRLLFPHPPDVKGRRFHGDLVTALFLIGINF